MFDKNLKVAIVGGTGILSTDVAEYALECGMKVTCFNRGKHLQFLPKGINNIVVDIRDVDMVKEKIKDQEYDTVVDFLSYKLDDLKSTLEIFHNKCKQYIFISSATVYQKKDESEVIKEGITSVTNEKWDYAKNKIACEKYLTENYNKTGQEYTIIRPYVTYGKTRIPYAVTSSGRYWSLANRILCDKPIVMWDKGEAVCTLTHTTEFCKGVVGLFMNDKAKNEAFHITSAQTLTWNNVLSGIEKALDKKAIVINMPSKYIENNMEMYKGSLLGDKATNMRFDNTKIREAVPGFECSFGFDEGIEDTIKYYKSHEYMRDIDYKWDSWLDNLIKKYCKENKIEIKKLKCQNYEKTPSFKDKLKYYLSKNKGIYNFANKLRNIGK